MGRISDAIRRAAETADQDTEAPAPASNADGGVVFPPEAREDADPIAADPPDEVPEPAPERASAPESSESPAPAERAPTEPPPVDGSMFETVRRQLTQKVVVDARTSPVSREQYRKLAAALHHAQEATGLGVVMIGSAVANEGKTLTACNLALTLSESYHRSVLLIDADLRRPMLHEHFQLDATSGLADGLLADEERPLPLHAISPYLSVLPAGRSRNDPMAALASSRMRRVLDEARHVFDWVIIDTPPVGILSDASLLSAMVDGAVIVIKAESTPYELVRRAVTAIGAERVLGVVLNRALAVSHREYGYESYHEYATTEGSPDTVPS